ncbi:hypothetical protein AB0O20_03070 [Streptomyces kronopolitis]|uniref:hypothetical protein n=1 Tax=Streptomyces kronopolitis TaxID=1612435 RepID=UPI003435590A
MHTPQPAPTRRPYLLSAAVMTAAVCTLTACGADTGATAKDSSDSSASATPKHLVLGQPGPVQELGQAASKFQITPVKVVEGTHEDLKELDDPGKYKAQKVAWVYVKAKNVGSKAAKDTLVMSDVGAEANGSPAQRLLVLMGDLSSRPKDCLGNNGRTELGTDDIWKPGEQRTVCEPYLLPVDTKITDVTYSQGFYKEPLKWRV